MERIKSLNRYQKGVLFFMVAMVLVFAAIYSRTTSTVGFLYQGTILVLSQDDENKVYSGKIQGHQAQFTVSADKTVVFQYDDKTYGPYTAKEDPTAIPQNEEMSALMTGVELLQGEDILFRGGVLAQEDFYLLYNENGALDNFAFSYVTDDGTTRDENGTIIDPIAPSVSTILELMNDPELTHKGEWLWWFCAVFICLLNALFLLFEDELFRLNLVFQIRDAGHAEPSDWEIAGRYIRCTIMPIMALFLFMVGLT